MTGGKLALIERFTGWLESRGRVDLRVIRSGEVLFKHFYPLWITRERPGGGTTPWPNIVIHKIFNTFMPALSHDHGRYVMSVIINGGYTEIRYAKDGSARDVVRRPYSWAFLGYDEVHNIKDVLPDTWTLFAFGPKFRDAYFRHPVTGKTLTRKDVDRLDKGGISGYQPSSAKLQERISRRREAVARANRMKIGDRNGS
jgi:hypothetical protein